MAACRCGRAGWCEGCQFIARQEERIAKPLTHEEELERVALVREREENERRHKQIVLRLAALEKKRLGQAYRFQNSHEAT